jgi:hypothetical protein
MTVAGPIDGMVRGRGLGPTEPPMTPMSPTGHGIGALGVIGGLVGVGR